MIVILKQNPNRGQLESLISWLQPETRCGGVISKAG